ncbi:hypothetical protein OJF2_22370 [Aquisphaera giovannonii]|uniref:PEP-CTERM protein-sorting domain-containing protein n=1 Tax=Aquisphaera giovannonii TaxID=406548 RepID=A0A5B9W0C3_9BACT|nr:hypothetical protein [Aquisphaera giovannonii]QEH33731.1 hypothetical protein OJF2_22370 [Aquisphaera giovannonii]
MKTFLIRFVWGLVALAGLVGPGSARADFLATLDVTTTPEAGGLTLYQYMLSVDPASDQAAVLLLINVDAAAGLTSISGPAGWEIDYNTGDTGVSWLSPGSDTDLLPGQSAVFSFASPLGAGDEDFLTVGDAFGAVQGRIAGPSLLTVPEPPSLWLLAGAAAAGFPTMTGRRRARHRS